MTAVYCGVDSGRMDKLTVVEGAVDGIVFTVPVPTWTTGSWVTPTRENTSTAQVGDRVRVTVEGTVVSASAYGLEVGKSWIDPTAPEVTSVEIVAADAGWLPGDVVSCDHGLSFLRSADQWVTHGGTKIEEPCDGPLTLLVRGGRTV